MVAPSTARRRPRYACDTAIGEASAVRSGDRMCESFVQRVVTAGRTVLIALLAVTAGSSQAMAQTHGAEVGGHVDVLRLSELSTSDAGVGPDVAWRFMPSLAIDGSLTWSPSASTAGSSQHQHRTLGLAGVRTGVT